MLWLVLVSLAISTGLAFGVLAAILRVAGRRASLIAAAAILVICLGAGGLAYSAYLEQRHGALPPDHFYNTVLGNIVVVGGLLASVGGFIGIAAAYLILLRLRA